MSLDPEEEDLEEVIVQNMEHALRRIHRVEQRCERKHGISRHQSLVIMNGLPKSSSDSKLQVKPRTRQAVRRKRASRSGLCSTKHKTLERQAKTPATRRDARSPRQ